MNIPATEEFLKRFLKDLKESQKRWCGDCVDDSEEILMEYPEWINSLVPEVEELLGVPKSGIYIVRAIYGSEINSKDVTKIFSKDVTELLQGYCYPNSISLFIDNRSMGGDPAPGLSKRLDITYTYDGIEHKAVVQEGKRLDIVEEKG
jgi:hypothetical protein